MEVLGLRSYTANVPCDFCPCDKDADAALWPHTYGPTCQWKGRLFTAAEWRALYPEPPHIFFRKFPYLSQHNVEPDELHVIHLGTSMYMLGSVLYLLVYRRFPMLRPAQAMARVWSMITNYYSQHEVKDQFSNITIGMFTKPARHLTTYPKLKGRGGEVKHLVGALRFVWASVMRAGDAMDELVLSLLDHQLAVQDIIDEFPHDMFLTIQAALLLRHHVDGLLDDYLALASAADAAGDCLWTLPPKLHWLWHLAHRAYYLHPRRGTCMVDEDFVGKIKRIVQRTLASKQLHLIPGVVMEKWRWAMQILHVYGLV